MTLHAPLSRHDARTGTALPSALKSAPVSLIRVAEAALAELEAQGLRRRPREVSGPQRARMMVDGQHVLCMCSNNSLGLAGHPVLAAAVREGLEQEGSGSGASRHISGNMSAHRQAEAALAAYVGQAESVFFSTGYAANLGRGTAGAARTVDGHPPHARRDLPQRQCPSLRRSHGC